MPRRTRGGSLRAASYIGIFQPPNTCVPPPTLHVKDAAQDAAEDMLGAEKDGSLTVLFVARAIFQRRETPRPTHARRPPRCPLATREGRAREGRGVGLGAGLGGGRLRCREGRVTVLIVPSRSSTSSSGGKPQAQHTRAAAHAAREGRGAGCGGGCCEGCVRCREGRLRPRERFLH